MVSGCSSVLNGRRGSGEIRFMAGGGRRLIMWVFWQAGFRQSKAEANALLAVKRCVENNRGPEIIN